MLALEDAYDFEFPDELLVKSTFESIAAIRNALNYVRRHRFFVAPWVTSTPRRSIRLQAGSRKQFEFRLSWFDRFRGIAVTRSNRRGACSPESVAGRTSEFKIGHFFLGQNEGDDP